MTKEEFRLNEQLPQLLTLDEINHPDKVIKEFFISYSLPEIREALKEWFHAALEDDIMIAEANKTSNLFSFYQNIESLLKLITKCIISKSICKVEYC